MTHDTSELLKEVNAGCTMATTSIEQVMPNVKDEKLKSILEETKHQHEVLSQDTRDVLAENAEIGQDPPMVARVMGWIQINAKMMMHDTDNEIASLITDGCNMGIKSLTEYLNKYESADEKAKNLTKSLICLEEKLLCDLKGYL